MQSYAGAVKKQNKDIYLVNQVKSSARTKSAQMGKSERSRNPTVSVVVDSMLRNVRKQAINRGAGNV